MESQDALTQTLYAQLKEEAVVFDSMVLGGGVRGSAYRITKDDRTYWYWQVSTPAGNRKVFVGRDSEETRAAVARLETQRQEHAELSEGLKRASAAFLASGGMSNEPSHFRVMDKLAQAGLFRKGLVLVGSHGFVSIGNALGVRWNSHMKTSDLDLARSQSIAIAVPTDSGETLSVPDVAKSADNSFFLVPELDPRAPSSTLMSRKTKVRIDFLTTQKSSDKTGTKYFPDIDITATPLRFMDYLLSGQNFKGLIVGNYAIPVMLPDPARFAVHKLIIAQERTLN
ncbi:MAG: GSU2403 family nucleotidyltransferase fold protein, partial [Sterolibacterium sp.]